MCQGGKVKGLFHNWSQDMVRVLEALTSMECTRQAHKGHIDDLEKCSIKASLQINGARCVTQESHEHGCAG